MRGDQCLLPLVVIASLLAWWQPGWMAGWAPAIVPLLMVVMFGMGLTLQPADFALVFKRPKLVGLGLLLQVTVMPLAAWLLGRLLQLSPDLCLGLYLLGATSGGTASNVVSYLARGDVALSVALTACSTVLACVTMPLWVWWLADTRMAVPVVSMFWSVAQIALLPVAVGMVLRQLLGSRLRVVQAALPVFSAAVVATIVGIIVALNRSVLADMAWTLAVAVVLHNAVGLAAGYGLSKLAGATPREARTIAIEVGMQNSGLAVALAIKYFSAAAAAPGALFSVWHNISGALAAWFWARERPGKSTAAAD